jgi:nucleoside 2-deoxyribosyltransferase
MEAVLGGVDERLKEKIGFWTRDQNELGELPVVGTYTVDLVRNLPDKTILERAERLLRYGIREQKDLGGGFVPNVPGVLAATYSRSTGDVFALAQLLYEHGWLRVGFRNGHAQVTPQGFMHASESNVSESVNGFIAMWFDKSMDAARIEGFEPAIREAGYTPVIVSGVEHINKIDDEIISQIRKAKFLVADFTGHRGGVYFEAGFAMGLGLPVFWTCRRDDLATLHFDIRQYNCIDWTDTADLQKRLKRRIEAIIGVGPVRPTISA